MDKMIPWKLLTFIGLAVLVLSFFIGIFSGVGFTAALLRAFLLGISFCLLSGGLSFIIRKFLPELFETYRNQKEADKGPLSSEEEAAEKVDIVLEGENPDLSIYSASDDFEDEETGDTEEDVEELAEEDAEEDSPTFTKTAVSSPEGESENFAVLEKLPGLDSFADSFSGPVSKGSSGNKESLDNMDNDNDPASLAKAIQTMLKKEQKG